MAKRGRKPKAKIAPAEKPAEPKYDTPEALAKFDAATFAALSDRQREMRESRQAFLAAKERATDLKKTYEAARIEYEDALDERKKYRGQKPPGMQLEITFERSASPSVDGTNPPRFTADAPNSDLWRKFPLDRWTMFGCTPSDVQNLKEGKLKKETGSVTITTVGELSDFTKPFASDPTRNRHFTDIKGIGGEGATRISDAEVRFWNEWNTKGLAAEFAREMGVNLDANGKTDGAGGVGVDGGGGDGDKSGEPAPVKRKRGRPKKIVPADEQPATVPFTGDQREPKEATA